MKFIVNAQLPVRLAQLLRSAGYDTLHTQDLPLKNATKDSEINAISTQKNRIVITKERDFLDSFLVRREPYKLLLLTTGNIAFLKWVRYIFESQVPLTQGDLGGRLYLTR